MIIYDPRSYSDILLRWEGSVLPQVLLHLLGTGIVSTVATIAQAQPDINFDLPDEGHKIFGFLVGFLLVFRSTIAYNRFWNGRGFLNGLQNESMEFMRNVCMFASSEAGWVSARGREARRKLAPPSPHHRLDPRDEAKRKLGPAEHATPRGLPGGNH